MGKIYNGWIQSSINDKVGGISAWQVVFSASINVV